MIATCPHCQNGFYISPDLAGNVVTCSKCKKQVRAPDRRLRGNSAPEVPSDGIPMAIIAETRAEAEERLKTETEARAEAEKKLKEAIEAKSKAEEQAKIDSKARAEAQEQLKAEVQSRSAMEARLSAETEAKTKAEEAVLAEKRAREELETRLKAEVEARSNVDTQTGAENRDLAELEAKLKDAVRAKDELELKLKDDDVNRVRAEARAESESQAKTQIEELLQAEVEARVKAESQAKAEAIAKKKAQTRLDEEVEAREKAEHEAVTAKTRLRDAEVAAIAMSPFNLEKGLMRLTFVLSFVFAGIAGLIAFRNGYIIWSHFDRPIRLPWSGEPMYLPIVLIAFCVGGFVAAWAAYLVAVFVIRGFRQPSMLKAKKHHQPELKDEEVVSSSECKMWRSS